MSKRILDFNKIDYLEVVKTVDGIRIDNWEFFNNGLKKRHHQASVHLDKESIEELISTLQSYKEDLK